MSQTNLSIAILAVMTVADARAILQEEYGISKPTNTPTDEVFAELCLQSGVDFEAVKAQRKNGSKKVTVKNNEPTDEDKKVIIGAVVMFKSGADAESQRDVWVSVNGKSAQIRRDIAVGVPLSYLTALKDSKKRIRKKDEKGAMTNEYTEIERYPFEIIQRLHTGEEHLLGQQVDTDNFLS